MNRMILSASMMAILALSAQESRAQTAKPKLTSAQERLQMLHIVGRMSGTQLYQTYLNIGFIADGKAEGLYEQAEAEQLLGSVVQLLNLLDADLEKISQTELSKEDRQGLDQVKGASRLLRQQAAYLLIYWKSEDDRDGDKYERTRQEAWETIRKLLNLK